MMSYIEHLNGCSYLEEETETYRHRFNFERSAQRRSGLRNPWSGYPESPGKRGQINERR
jgi:hypothetical protein